MSVPIRERVNLPFTPGTALDLAAVNGELRRFAESFRGALNFRGYVSQTAELGNISPALEPGDLVLDLQASKAYLCFSRTGGRRCARFDFTAVQV